MIAFIKGIILEKESPSILIDVNGLGYEVLAPMTTIYKIANIGEEIKLYTQLIVREDSQTLFGFISKTDKRVFQELIKVNGIGAKMALAILSGMDSYSLMHCIENKDYDLLCTIPGIGRKTAERLVVDIKDKISKLITDLYEMGADCQGAVEGEIKTSRSLAIGSKFREAINALEVLGYKNKESERIVKKVYDESLSVEEIIRFALKNTK